MEMNVRRGTKVADKEFVVLTELLMVQLLKLDGIEADGEAKVQRRVEVINSIVFPSMFTCYFVNKISNLIRSCWYLTQNSTNLTHSMLIFLTRYDGYRALWTHLTI